MSTTPEHETSIPITPLHLTAGTVTEIVWLAPDRPHTVPDDRGCPDCGQDSYDSGCTAPGCNGCGCPDCGTGCDSDFTADEGGRCATALAYAVEEASTDA